MDDRTLFARAGEVIEARLGDETVLLGSDMRYHGLDSIGGRIWDLLAAPTSIADLANSLCVEYEVEPNVALADVRAFIAQLADRSLVVMA